VDESVRRKIGRLVAGIVVADGDFDPTEDFFLDRLLERLGLGDRSAIEPLPDASQAAIEMAGLSPEERDAAFTLLLEAALADGQVVTSERVYLLAVGAALGLDGDAVEERIERHAAEQRKRFTTTYLV
jgi:uncharacterized tellurite resistance protein B-like protein